MKIYDKVIIFCPWIKTGGTEAIHQLSSAINELGGNCFIMYADLNTRINLNSYNKIVLENSPNLGMILYENYNVSRKEECIITNNTLIVFPEVFAHLIELLPVGIKSVWWLSIDNSFLSQQSLYTENQKNSILNDTVFNFYQSEYAKCELQKNNISSIFPLFDYVNINIQKSKYDLDKNLIAYYPHKGKQLSDKFVARNNNFNYIKLSGIGREIMDDILSNVAIYIDFGHHPGKDRIPREASIAGAVVLLNKAGSSLYFKDHPLDEKYLFTESDINNGNLYHTVQSILSDRKNHFKQQSNYREQIKKEKEQFYEQVKTLFFRNI